MYNAFHHQNFSNRMINWFRTFQQLRVEAEKLDGIYVNEALSSGAPAFDDTAYNTADELVDGITFMRHVDMMVTGGNVPATNRISNITPFLAGE